VIDGAVKRTVRSDGVELAVIEAGNSTRPTLVFVHGYPDTKELWSAVLERLAPRYHLVAYDVRGAGESSAPRRSKAYDFARLADDLEAVIEAVAPGRPVHLIGHDWGAIQGWEFVTLERFDGRLASFTAVAGPSLDQVAVGSRALLKRPTPSHLARLARRLRRSWYVLALWTPGVPTLAWRWLLARPRWGWWLRHVERVPVRDGHPAPTLADDGRRGSKLYRRNIPRRMLRPRVERSAHAPVQVVIPTRDHFISPDYYEPAARFAPLLRRRLVGTTHWVPRTQPALLASWIDAFVAEVEAGRPASSGSPWVRGGWLEQLHERLAVVTGAGSGIWRATAAALAAHGARVVLVDRDSGALAQAALDIPARGTFICDVSDERAMERLCDHVLARHGVPDVVVNNAGVGVAGPFLETSIREWRRVLGINLMGVVHGCQLFGREMVQRGEGGHIVNIASAAAFQPAKDLAAYSASKAAVLMVSECLRAELGPHGIGVTAVCPGFIHTNITRTARYVGQAQEDERRLAERVTRLYERRNFTPEQVAAEILRAIGRDRPVAVITLEARFMRAVSRFAPGLARRLAQLETLPA
jgi:NAD(P)-dependent dehydrogenase (short-subunit alcohol dehydrogenase family)/pimeloyl-ACP methyl ester carboxylesterase